jgi:V/A-type H+/Na+-transporting ATPase subunit D
MTRLRGMPAGRAGRGWLARRISTADRAASLMDRKLRMLNRERERYERRAIDAQERWAGTLAEAEEWALRATLLGGAGALLPDHAGDRATVTLEWAAVMGARFPSGARLSLPAEPTRAWLPASAAVDAAAAAFRRALEDAVEAATASAAARVVAAEIDATRFRKRAIVDRWLPRLHRASTELDLMLNETEASEGIRMRLAAPDTRGGRHGR